jgi:uncharacterized protein
MFDRPNIHEAIESGLRTLPICCLLGPRQCGKTTLARAIAAATAAHFFDLEDPRDLQRLAAPMTALESLRGLIILDEVQRVPELFPILRVLADRPGVDAKFLLLGSASFELVQGASESLAGRIHIVEMSGFSIEELAGAPWRTLLLRGGFPRAFLAETDAGSLKWRDDFTRTFLERDLFQLGPALRTPANVRRLWTMLAHRHGQLLNVSDLAASLGETMPTIKRHIGLLGDGLVLRQLQPWHGNTEKRIVKSPKVYIRDSGILHSLLGVATFAELEGHPTLGASFEGFAVEEVIRTVGARSVYFWRTHGGAELDIYARVGTKKIGFEMKWGDAPRPTKSMHSAMRELELDALFVLYPGDKSWLMHERTWVWPITDVAGAVARI